MLLQCLQELVVLIGLDPCNVHLLLELAEGAGLRALVLLQELQDLLDALAGELLADGVEVGALVLPELELGGGVGVVSLLEGLLGVLAKLSLDLLGPVADGTLEHRSLVLRAGLLVLGDIGGRQGQRGLTLHQPERHLGVGEELVELVHQVLANQVGPADLVERVAQNGQENFL